MRRRIVMCLMVIGLIFGSIKVNAEDTQPELIKGYATAYCLEGTTASGCKAREGICAGNDDYYGKTLILYKRLPNGAVGARIGIYECYDKGGSTGIKSGKVIDVWCDGLDACQDYMDILYEDGCNGKVYIQVIEDAVG